MGVERRRPCWILALEAMIYATSKVLVTAAASEPVTLEEARAHLRVTHTEDDSYIVGLIALAREHCEEQLNKPVGSQTFRAYYPCFDVLVIPAGDVTAVSAVKYYPLDGGAAVTVSSSVYWVDLMARPAVIRLVYGQEWPTADLRESSAVEVTFTAGSAATVSVKHAMKLLIGHWYEHREEVIVTGDRMMASAITLPRAVDSLLVNQRSSGVIL